MNRVINRFCLLMAILAVASGTHAADVVENKVGVEGSVATTESWTADQIKSTFSKDAKTIKYVGKDHEHSATGVPLLSLVNAAGPQLDPKVKNDQLRFVVVVIGKDGYVATFALAELLPEVGNREAWVTLDADDKPLSERDTPADLIVPADHKLGRWVHGIKTIRVVRMETAAKN